MPNEVIDIDLLGNVTGGEGEAAPAGPVCTPDNPTGQPPQRYWENSPPGQQSGGGHGGGGGHQPHLDPPVNIRQPRPWRPTIMPGRSDRRLKRHIRAV